MCAAGHEYEMVGKGCPECKRIRARALYHKYGDKYREKNRERARIRAAMETPEQRAARQTKERERASRSDQRERYQFNAQERRRLARNRILAAYGEKCACCGESDEAFLVVDHINGGGREHRRAIGGSHRFYGWLVREGFPPGFQILCYNCNAAKERHDGCPHRRKA